MLIYFALESFYTELLFVVDIEGLARLQHLEEAYYFGGGTLSLKMQAEKVAADVGLDIGHLFSNCRIHFSLEVKT